MLNIGILILYHNVKQNLTHILKLKMILKEAITEFIISQRVKGSSNYTIINQTYDLKLFSNYMDNDIDIEKITVSDLNGYYLYLVGKNLSSTSVQSYIRVVRTFFNWCIAQNYITQRLTERFRLPKAKQNVIDILTEAEIQKLLSSFNLSKKIGFRNYLICLLMLDCGLRLSEIVSLRAENIYISESHMIVDGKGNKQRFVPFGSTTKQTLAKYLESCGSERGSLFYSVRNLPISRMTVTLIFRRLKDKIGIHRLRPHLLRHTFATMYLENGGNIFSLQAILGHTSLVMVKRYLHLSQSKVLRDFHKFSPMDNLK